MRNDLHSSVVPMIKSEKLVPRTINSLLKIHGLQLKSKRVRVERKRVQTNGVRRTIADHKINKYFIITLIDYESFHDLDINLETLPGQNTLAYD